MWPPFEDVPEVEVKSFIGVIFSCIGNILISVALNIQKSAHNKIQQQYHADNPVLNPVNPNGNGFVPDDGYDEPRLSEDSLMSPPMSPSLDTHAVASTHQEEYVETSYLKSKSWWLGVLLMVTGEAGNFIAYGFAPASTIAPLGTVALVSNVILAPVMLHERFRIRDFFGVLLAVTGAVVVVVNSKSKEVKLTPEAIQASLIQTQFLIYTAANFAVGLLLSYFSDTVGHRLILIDLGLVAIFGGYTVLATKGLASLLSLTPQKVFTHLISYLLVFVLVFTAIMQVKYLNKSLQRFDSTEVIPTQLVLFTIFAIMGSAVLYHDFEKMDATKLIFFVCGCFLEFLGIYVITSKRKKQRMVVKPKGVRAIDPHSVVVPAFSRPRPRSLRLQEPMVIPNSPLSPRFFQAPATPRSARGTFSLPSSYHGPSVITPLLHENLSDTGENLIAVAYTALSAMGTRQNANLFADVLYSSGNAAQFPGINNGRRGSLPAPGPISLSQDSSESGSSGANTLPRRMSRYFSIDLGRNQPSELEEREAERSARAPKSPKAGDEEFLMQ